MLGGKLPLSVLDQALLSGSSFLLSLLMARSQSRSGFGAFAVAYAVLLLANSFLMALVLKPFMLLGDQARVDARRRLSAYMTGQLVLSGSLGLIVAVIGMTLVDGELTWTFVALGLAFAPVHLNELLRRAHLVRLAVGPAVLQDSIFAGVLVGGLLALLVLGRLSAATGLVHLGVSAMLSAAVSMRLLGVRPTRQLSAVREECSQAWRFAGWSGLVTVVDAVEGRAYALLAAAALGLTGPAVLEVARVAVSPTNVVVFPVLNLLMPLTASRFAEGRLGEVRRVRRQALAVTAGVTIAYGAVASLAPELVLAILYGPRYLDAVHVLRAFCVYHVVTSLSGVVSVSLESMRRPRAVFVAQLGSVVTGLAVAWLSVGAFAEIGIVSGMIAGTVVGLVTKLALVGMRPESMTTVASCRV